MFGELVAAHRHRLGLTQAELARRADLSVRAIRDLESGRVQVPRQVSVRLLAEAFALRGQEREEFVRRARAGRSPSPGTASAAEAAFAPAQLPSAVAGFTGRSAQLDLLDAAAAVQPGSPPVTVVISAVSGTAGVGKTALAVHWAHRARDRFPDGQLYVNLRGFDPGGAVMVPPEAVRLFLDALGVPAERIPADLDAQAGLYRSLLAGRRMLVVLDNARDAEQVRPLLPGEPGCVVVVTSRSDLSGLVAAVGAQPLTLDLLTEPESWQLLAARLGSARLAAEPDVVEEIVERCARLPLALAIVAARAAAHPDFPLSALAAELRDPAERLDALADRDPGSDLRAVFSWSYRALSPSAARLFRLLGLHPGPDVSAPAAASLAGQLPAQVRAPLAELTSAHLLAEHSPGRYTFHDLLRAYAAELTHDEDRPGDRRAAVHRLLDHYLHTAHTAARLLAPYREQITLSPPEPGVTPEHAVDDEQALRWFTVEHPVLMAAVAHASRAGFDTHAWQLPWTLATFLLRRGHWHDHAATQLTALEAARRLGDPLAQARAHRLLGRAHTWLCRYDEAGADLRQALDLYGQAGDQIGQGHTHMDLARVCDQQGGRGEALDHSRRALQLFRAGGDRRGQALALSAVGWCHARLGDHEQALAQCEQSLVLLRELGDRQGEAETWDSVGYAHHNLRRYPEAVACYQRSLELLRELGFRYPEARTLINLGDTHDASGDRTAARDAWREALAILEELDHSDADDVRTKLREIDGATGSSPAVARQ